MEQMDDNKKELNKREVLMGHAYVFLLFFITAIACCAAIFMWNTDFKLFEQKEFIKIKMNRIKEYQQVQSDNLAVTDSLFHRIETFDPGIHAQYEEDDIKYLINSLKNIYEHNSWDKRYKALMHIGDFYEMWLTDKKQMWSIKQNINMFKENLEKCELGLEKKKEDIHSDTKK